MNICTLHTTASDTVCCHRGVSYAFTGVLLLLWVNRIITVYCMHIITALLWMSLQLGIVQNEFCCSVTLITHWMPAALHYQYEGGKATVIKASLMYLFLARPSYCILIWIAVCHRFTHNSCVHKWCSLILSASANCLTTTQRLPQYWGLFYLYAERVWSIAY